ncbi:hypothetical protein GWK47_054035 [Chionoecetes opilio]|uniref:Uncharacterized protein n=1 Tax=Chionoecetes opilio TaxID=41210 RepID=A0A8J5CP95_CHIOP|nr:hypothetical protein GWK47_054035 [Chionoecetes opilio]
MATRAASNLWLIDKAPIDEITGARLPSKEQVLLRYYHHHREMGKTASRSRKAVVEEVLPFWSRAGIPTTTVIRAGTKLSKLVKAYNDLKKNKNKDRPKHLMDEEIFKGDLQEIFDLAHSSSLQRADVKDEDKEFLWSQREDRGESSMAGIDLVTAKKVEKQIERGTRLKRLQEREDSDIARLAERAEIPSQSSSSSNSPVSTTSSPARGSRSQRKKLKQSPLISVKDLNLISTWDREKLSVRKQRQRLQLLLKFLEWTLRVWRSRSSKVSSIEHELRGEKPPRRLWNCGTRRYLRGWSCIGTENSSRPSLAIRRTASPSSSQGKMMPSSFLESRQARIRLAETWLQWS